MKTLRSLLVGGRRQQPVDGGSQSASVSESASAVDTQNFAGAADATWFQSIPDIYFAQGTSESRSVIPYSTNFNSTAHEMQLAETSAALPAGVTLVPTGSLAYSGTSPSATVSGIVLDIEDKLATWATRSTAAGVVRAFSFADSSQLGAGPGGFGYGYNYGWYDDGGGGGGNNDHPVHDTVVHPGSGGSLRFELDATRGGGSWTTNFSSDLTTRFNVGDSVFCQWRQRFNAAYIGPQADGSYAARKQCLVSTADTSYAVWDPTAGTGVAGSCRPIELCVQSYDFGAGADAYVDLFPIAYTRCPGWGGTINLVESHPTEFLLLQNMMPAPYCSYNNINTGPGGGGTNPPNGNCFIYVPDEWMTFQTGITVGPTRVGDQVAGSRFRVWGQRQGQPSVLLIDMTVTMTFPANDPGYGKFWFTQYNQSASPRNALWQTWVSELIVSTQRIPDAL